ncbi:hypothetical protein CGRA01v4_04712 [Colletotrichum graminicola]|nr:hypothetical protein CGRA01v4_04712 [Colletotrichum graminicola]
MSSFSMWQFATNARRLCPQQPRVPSLVLGITPFPRAHGTKRTLNDVGRGHQYVPDLLARATRTFPSFETGRRNTENATSREHTSCRCPTSKLSSTAVTVRVPWTLQEAPPLISAADLAPAVGQVASYPGEQGIVACISSGHGKRNREKERELSLAL